MKHFGPETFKSDPPPETNKESNGSKIENQGDEPTIPEILERIRFEKPANNFDESAPKPPPLPTENDRSTTAQGEKNETNDPFKHGFEGLTVYKNPFKDSGQPSPEEFEHKPDPEYERWTKNPEAKPSNEKNEITPEEKARRSFSSRAQTQFVSASTETKSFLGSALSGVYERHIKGGAVRLISKMGIKVHSFFINHHSQKKEKQRSKLDAIDAQIDTYKKAQEKLRLLSEGRPDRGDLKAEADKLNKKMTSAEAKRAGILRFINELDDKEQERKTKRRACARRINSVYEAKLEPVRAEIAKAEQDLNSLKGRQVTVAIDNEALKEERDALMLEYTTVKQALTDSGKWKFQIARNPTLRNLESKITKIGGRMHANEVNMNHAVNEQQKLVNQLQKQMQPYSKRMEEYRQLIAEDNTRTTVEQGSLRANMDSVIQNFSYNPPLEGNMEKLSDLRPTVNSFTEAWNKHVDSLSQEGKATKDTKLDLKEFMKAMGLQTEKRVVSEENFGKLLKYYFATKQPKLDFKTLWDSFNEELHKNDK